MRTEGGNGGSDSRGSTWSEEVVVVAKRGLLKVVLEGDEGLKDFEGNEEEGGETEKKRVDMLFCGMWIGRLFSWVMRCELRSG